MLLDIMFNFLLYFPTLSYSSTNDHNPQIEYYAHHYTDNPKIKKHIANNMADSGGAELYIVQSEDQNFVIKLEKPSKIKKETEALTRLNNENLTPTLMGVAQFMDDQGDCTGVLIETFVQGETLHSYLEKVGQASNPLSRWLHELRLKKAIKSIAQKLSHLHSLESHPIHNDLHPGNIFYNSDKDESTLIDLELTSFGKQRAEEDIAYFFLTFEMYASKYNITKTSMEKFKKSFLRNYKRPLDHKLIQECTKMQIEEFKEHFSKDGSKEEKVLLKYLHSL